jgi:hypothetical protein
MTRGFMARVYGTSLVQSSASFVQRFQNYEFFTFFSSKKQTLKLCKINLIFGLFSKKKINLKENDQLFLGNFWI